MNESFERLPIRGLEVVRVEVVAGRFVSMILSGIAESGDGHAIVEYALQFNQVSRVHLSDAFAKTATVVELSASKESSTTPEYRISFGYAAIEIQAVSFMCSAIRSDEFLEEDEKRWAKTKR